MADQYNSAHTGAEIDQAVSDVQNNKAAWMPSEEIEILFSSVESLIISEASRTTAPVLPLTEVTDKDPVLLGVKSQIDESLTA